MRCTAPKFGIDILILGLAGTITSILPGGGAHRSGLLRVGDVIERVNGDYMRGMTANEVALAIRGSQSLEVMTSRS